MLAKMLPISPTEQAGGSRVTDPDIAPKKRGRPKTIKGEEVDKTKQPPKKQRQPKAQQAKEEKPKRARNTGKDDEPKKKKQTPKKKDDKKGKEDDAETAAKAAIRARNSRKSSAYHTAFKKALAAGLEGSEAKAKAKEVLRLFSFCFGVVGFGTFK